MKATRIQYDQKVCPATGCGNKFMPSKKNHKYCSDKCRVYMAVKRHRRRNK